MRKIGCLVLGLVVLAGCQDKDMSSISETAGLQAQKQIELENQNRGIRVLEMESDLSNRHRFFQGVKGVYEGTFQTEAGTRNIRVTLDPSVPPYQVNRIRTIEEVSYDLTNLHLNVQITQWDPAHRLSGVGCPPMEVHPDLRTGGISIVSSQCTTVYMLSLSDLVGIKKARGGIADPSLLEVSSQVALSLLDGKQRSVDAIVGQIQLTTNAEIYYFSATRVK
jgi:hypothetical protein